MIRFCDKEIYCVDKSAFGIIEIWHFLIEHKEDSLCFLNKEGQYIGIITYYSFFGKLSEQVNGQEEEITSLILENVLEEALQREYLIFDESIWETGRKYFANRPEDVFGRMVLPVLDNDHHLLCFAWQDDEANREIRMLEELMELGTKAMGFGDVFPEYTCVTLEGCNELVYYMIQYLKKQGISINIKDKMWAQCNAWKEFITWTEEVLEYKNLIIYGEGVGSKEVDVQQRRTVSVEFECVDKIYEENIRRRIIKNADRDFCDLINRLRNKQIALLGIGKDSLNTYDMLLKNDIDIECFVSEDIREQGHLIFGKMVIGRNQALKKFSNIAFLESSSKYSAWGEGDLEIFSYYLGCKRNENIFFIKDYEDVQNNGLVYILGNILKRNESNLILFGDMWLCSKLKNIMERHNFEIDGRIAFCDILEEYKEEVSQIQSVSFGEITEEDICLIVIPDYYHWDAKMVYYWESYRKEQIYARLKELNSKNIIEYPIHNEKFMKSNCFEADLENTELKIGKIVIGAIEPYSGNIFFRGLLDDHPDVLMLEYSPINNNLFSICIRLAMQEKKDILPLFWRLYYVEYRSEPGVEWEWNEIQRISFNKYMSEMLEKKEYFTSQEIFVMIHVAYAKIWGKEVKNLCSMTIYWEPHCVPLEQCEDYAIWLNQIAISGCIFNLVRNAYIKSGSIIKEIEKQRSGFGVTLFSRVFEYPCYEKKKYSNWKRVVVKFEDLKCKPDEELNTICNYFGISWSDTLLDTTKHGKKEFYGNISGFDLAPVYRTHEEYFSEFDRFRITLAMGPWLKRYGYPYVKSLNFSRRELQDMFLKEFRFEEKICYSNIQEKIVGKRWAWSWISKLLWMTRRMEVTESV